MQTIDAEALHRRARLTIIWIYIFLGISVAAGLSYFAAAATDPDQGNASTLSLVKFGLALLQLLIYFISGFLILRWIYKTNQAAHILGGDAMTMSPGWNVGWFFIPIGNLFKPFEGLRESYQATVNFDAPYAVEVPGAMRLWWGTWIASSILSNAAMRLQMMAPQGSNAMTVVNVTYGIVGIIAIPLSLSLIATVREVTEAQASASLAEAFS